MSESFEDLEKQLAHVMRADRFRFRRELRQARQKGKAVASADRLARRIAESRQTVEQRAASKPRLEFDPELPISARVDEIRTAIEHHPVIVVSGETGSGKSTQLPKICVSMGLAVDGMVGHTQPRRLAARSIADRLAKEMGSPPGRDVGFKIRFTDHTRPSTLVKLMTDGILLAETQSDRFLDQYNALIIDEAHERSLNIDFLLGYVRRLMEKRRDLKLIITSATIDSQRFAEHFAIDGQQAPVIEVSGRTYPVDVRYRPIDDDEADDSERDLADALADGIDELADEGPGDILVFLPTEQEIRSAAKLLRGRVTQNRALRGAEILPLYARLPTSQQQRVFETSNHRRIVLATNVAESSLTVPGIRYVLDTGTARISRYSPRSKVQRLPIEAVSRASADQRAGRCGRIGPGICLRLYGEQDYLQRDRFTTPEIRRTNLAAVILRALALRLGDLESFPFLDPPRPDAIREGFRTLYELQAIDDRNQLTELGQQLSRLPVDPRIGRILIAAREFNCLQEILIIAAGLEVQDPRDRPAEKAAAADAAHERFRDERSDFLSFLKMWDFYHDLREELSHNRLRKACHQSFLSFQRIRQWLDIHRQLKQLVREAGMPNQKRTDDYDAIHKALLTGLLSGIATVSDRHEFLGAGGVKFFLWPGSGLFKSKPNWVVSAEVVETTRRYGRTLANIDPKWIEPLAGHLIKKGHSDPHWHRKSARCMAFERVTLFGLTIVPRRRIPYGSIDPDLSRSLFIETGLVEGEYDYSHPFLTHNRQVLDELDAMRSKTRERELVIDSGTLVDFYERNLPPAVIDGPTLQRALRDDPALNNKLAWQLGDLIASSEPQEDRDAYPDELDSGGMKLALEYCYQPGEDADGVTVVVPAAGFSQLNPAVTSWMIPGLLEERIIGLIRSLPKRIRRNLTPAPDTARAVAKELDFGVGEFLPSVAQALGRHAGEPVPVEEFQPEKLAQHLTMNIRVVDAAGSVVAEGRHMADLQEQLGLTGEGDLDVASDSVWNQAGLTAWEFDELPAKVMIRQGAVDVPAYPCLRDRGESVDLTVVADADTARYETRAGMMRLLTLAARREIRSQVQWIPGRDQMNLYAAPAIGGKSLDAMLTDLIAVRAVEVSGKPPKSRQQWDALIAEKARWISIATQDVARIMPPAFESLHRARVAWEDLRADKYGQARADMQSQMKELLSADSLPRTPWEWLEQLNRYFQAITVRCEKISQSFPRDQESMHEIQRWWQEYQTCRDELDSRGLHDPALVEFRWMIEEYRVSLFAQTLGTYVSVSPQRLEKAKRKIRV